MPGRPHRLCLSVAALVNDGAFAGSFPTASPRSVAAAGAAVDTGARDRTVLARPVVGLTATTTDGRR